MAGAGGCDVDAGSVVRPCLLPERRFLCGPVTCRRIARLCLVYLGIFLLGLAIAHWAGSAGGKAFGLGLMVPGGGFLAHADAESWHGAAHFGAFIIALMLFSAALLVWFATGNVLAPPLIWFFCALAAVSMDHGDVGPNAVRAVSLSVVAAIVVAVILSLGRYAYGAARREEANRYLKTADVAAAIGGRGDAARGDEFTARDLKLMRFLLDRALQPVGNFDGFEWLDQFQTAAVRYQLNFIGYALSMAQATRLPALGGYLNDAQRRLIDKQTDHRIWRYWAIENLWGNLRTDPNPVVRENIMFTGFCAAQIAMYHAASGCRDYDRPGSFALRHPSGRSYDCDLPALIAALDSEHKRSAFHLIACEPNWIYALQHHRRRCLEVA
jgi:Linalool dehydratase/isomerase